MSNISVDGGSKKESPEDGKAKSLSFGGFFKQIKQNPVKGLNSEKITITSDIKKKIKTLNKRIQETVAYGKEMFDKAIQLINNKIGISKTLLPKKSPQSAYSYKSEEVDTTKSSAAQSSYEDPDSALGTKQDGAATGSLDDDTAAQQDPELHAKSTSQDGHVKKKTLNLINSLKNISAMADKKDMPTPNHKLVGIVS